MLGREQAGSDRIVPDRARAAIDGRRLLTGARRRARARARRVERVRGAAAVDALTERPRNDAASESTQSLLTMQRCNHLSSGATIRAVMRPPEQRDGCDRVLIAQTRARRAIRTDVRGRNPQRQETGRERRNPQRRVCVDGWVGVRVCVRGRERARARGRNPQRRVPTAGRRGSVGTGHTTRCPAGGRHVLN